MTDPTRYFQPSTPRLFGHRGDAGSYPENTLPAFRSAVEAGLPYLELDVWASRDGTVVVHHDPTLERCCGRPEGVPRLDLAEIRTLDAGFGFSPDGGRTHPFRGRGIGVPTLEEVLREFPGSLFNIEIKQEDPPIEGLVAETVRRFGCADRVLLAAEKDRVMERLRKVWEGPSSLSFGELEGFFGWLAGGGSGPFRPPGQALQIPETWGDTRLVTRESVAAAHALDLEVHVWTVNRPGDMRRLLDMGVDGLMSDHAALLKRTVAAAGSIQGK